MCYTSAFCGHGAQAAALGDKGHGGEETQAGSWDRTRGTDVIRKGMGQEFWG